VKGVFSIAPRPVKKSAGGALTGAISHQGNVKRIIPYLLNERLTMNKETFKQIRLSRNLTQNDLAVYMRVSMRQIKRYENGFSAIPGPVAFIMDALATGRWPRRPNKPLTPRQRGHYLRRANKPRKQEQKNVFLLEQKNERPQETAENQGQKTFP
jgi:transcriptional regulator with XRE-family HTH domain